MCNQSSVERKFRIADIAQNLGLMHLKTRVYTICTAFKDKDDTGAVSQ
jgi:hypothetical protein